MRIFIATDRTANDRKALAAVRAFGRHGDHVTVGSDSFLAEPFLSRYCDARVGTPSPRTDPAAYLRCLLDLFTRQEFDAFLPMSDYTTIAAVHYQEELAAVVPLAVPPRGARRVAADKLATLRLAAGLGIQGPETFAPGSRAEVVALSRRLDYPCVLKLRGSAGSVGMSVPRNADELLAAFDGLPQGGDDLYDYRPLIQAFVPGTVHDVCMLFDRGKPRAVLTQERTRTWPPRGGMGALDTTTHEPELAQAGVRLFEALNWHGPGQAEFMIDSRDGTPRLMEINPRFWGTVEVAIHAGVDFPRLTALLARDGHVDAPPDYPAGIRFRWLFPNGVRHVVRTPDKWAAVRELFLSRTGSDFQWSDPLASLFQPVRPILDGARRRAESLRLRHRFPRPVGTGSGAGLFVPRPR